MIRATLTRLQEASDALHQRCYDASIRFMETGFGAGLKAGVQATALVWTSVALDRFFSTYYQQQTGWPIRTGWENCAPITAGALAGILAPQIEMDPKILAQIASAAAVGLTFFCPEEPLMEYAGLTGIGLLCAYYAIRRFQSDFEEAQNVRARGGFVGALQQDFATVAGFFRR